MFWSLCSLPWRSSIPQLPSFCLQRHCFPPLLWIISISTQTTCLSIFKTTVTSTTSHDLIFPFSHSHICLLPSQWSISKNDLYLLSWLFNSSCSTLQFATGPRSFTTTELIRVTGDSFIVKQCTQFEAYLSGALDTDDPLFLLWKFPSWPLWPHTLLTSFLVLNLFFLNFFLPSLPQSSLSMPLGEGLVLRLSLDPFSLLAVLAHPLFWFLVALTNWW